MVQDLGPISLFPANTSVCVYLSVYYRKYNISIIIFIFLIDQTITSTNHHRKLTASRKAAEGGFFASKN